MGRPTRTIGITLLAAAAALAAAVARILTPLHAAQVATTGSYVWNLPKGFPQPQVPAGNPMTPAKVELGKFLFYDTRLSSNGKSSCATCHRQELAFTDGRPVSIGTTGEKHPRGAMSLVNVAYSAVLTWNNPEMREMEQQALVPMFGEHPIELGLHGEAFLSRLRLEARYRELFRSAFPEETDPYTLDNVTRSIACFERSIISARSAYDRYHYGGDDTAISESAKRGEVLFFSQPLSCFRCHGGFTFSDNTTSVNRTASEVEFHNTGLYNVAGGLSYPTPNTGIFEVTHKPEDVGKFKAPMLRNIAVTAPYMHDGSIATLEGVLEHYAAGGRTIEAGPWKGAGHDNPLKDPLIGGFPLSEEGKRDLIEFLKALTDEEVLRDRRFANPWR